MMRTMIISLAVTASALAVATPASAQWARQPAPYGYGAPGYGAPGYGQGYNNYRHAGAVKARIDGIQRQIAHLAQYRMITRSEHNNLMRDSREIERRFFRNARDGRGLTQREMYDVERRVARLEQKIARDVRDGRRWSHRW